MIPKRKYLSVEDVQKEYIPGSKKKIRALLKRYLPVKTVGGRLLVSRDELEHLLSDPDRDYFPLK